MQEIRLTLNVTNELILIPKPAPTFRIEVRPNLPIEPLMGRFVGLGATPALPCFMPGLEDIPALVMFTLHNVQALSDALEYAVAFKDWWLELHQDGETPEGKISYRNGDEEYTIHLKGADLDVNKLAEMFFKKVGKKTG